ncbi:hypothetical protein DPMN_012603 [Dreissena polymorpha]|uniref:Reverse transcriptase zinc-binding domain-containing protein n=1 Tax=Dreissena polymorpha TaxID=45954 RepID=A0A9D4N6A6_DREPO|nr:hypothetical protein DPMN_012603 [Dreissena polymorpha]
MYTEYTPGKLHLVLQVGCLSALEVTRLSVRFRLLTGTYILQVNRSRFNQYAIDPVCPNCKDADETVGHFLLQCPALKHVRGPVMCEIWNILNSIGATTNIYSPTLLVQALIDWSTIVPYQPRLREKQGALEFLVRRLIFLHTEK